MTFLSADGIKDNHSWIRGREKDNLLPELLNIDTSRAERRGTKSTGRRMNGSTRATFVRLERCIQYILYSAVDSAIPVNLASLHPHPIPLSFHFQLYWTCTTTHTVPYQYHTQKPAARYSDGRTRLMLPSLSLSRSG